MFRHTREFIPLLSLSLLLTAGFPAPVSSQGHSPSQGPILEAKSAIEGTRQALADFESRLEFPLSNAEKEKSQKDFNLAREKISKTLPAAPSDTAIAAAANSALDLARKASSQASSGDRNQAIEFFTRSRIDLFKARALLDRLEAMQNATARKTGPLQGNARQDDASLSASHAGSAPGNGGNITIVSSTPTSTDTVRINSGEPSAININSYTPGAQSQVGIGPGGISVGAPGANAGIGIGPGGINIGSTTPGADAGIGIGPGGIQIGANTPGANTGISVTPGGVNIGGLGATIGNFARAGIDTALGTVDGVLGSGGSANITIAGRDQTRVIDCNGQRIAITGRNNQVTVRGYCQAINIMGHDNRVVLETIGSIGVTGHDNRVTWSQGPNGIVPRIFDTGHNNSISRHALTR
ncbi:MAG: DUF3060 domain-containing protein [Cyanobacteria bacterium HKST-UBA02]|nr:DUF3060 domain-containing protein [Cyanobacteria bacterium HKST-UBA02]